MSKGEQVTSTNESIHKANAQVWYEAIDKWIMTMHDVAAYDGFVRDANLSYGLYLAVKNGYVRIADLTRAGRNALYEGYDYLWTSNLIPHNEGN
jgi:hypothetical protein